MTGFFTSTTFINGVMLVIWALAVWAFRSRIRGWKKRADRYWQRPPISELTPWPSDPSRPARLCPRMTAVQDSADDGLKSAICLDAVTIGAWIIYVRWWFMGPLSLDKLLGIGFSAVIMGTITYWCARSTLSLIRASRVMIVTAKDEICGMHDDWPVLATAGGASTSTGQSNQETVADPDIQQSPVTETEGDNFQTFTLPDEDALFDDLDEQREVG